MKPRPVFNELWPLRRVGAKPMTNEERDYRQRVRENKRQLKKLYKRNGAR